MDEPTLIFVKRGFVVGIDGAPNFVVVDYDMLDIGSCPLCSSILLEDHCEYCDLDWSGDLSPDQIRLAIKSHSDE